MMGWGVAVPVGAPIANGAVSVGWQGRAVEMGIGTSNETHGHRFLGPGPFKVKNFADYETKLPRIM